MLFLPKENISNYDRVTTNYLNEIFKPYNPSYFLCESYGHYLLSIAILLWINGLTLSSRFMKVATVKGGFCEKKNAQNY